MALYLIGDVQGCDSALGRLLDVLDFSPSRDRLVLLGDLVNRGPDSLGVLRRLMALGADALCLLGNHDLHLLGVAAGARRLHRKDTLQDVLQAPDSARLLDWLAQQRMAWWHDGCLMVHAGVLPSWDHAQTMSLAGELEAVLRSPQRDDFLRQMYGNEPAQWHDGLQGIPRLRVIVNALTRLRFCNADGVMEFDAKEGADTAPEGYMPWFDVPGRRTANVTVAFGHWSTLGHLHRHDLLSMDSGCVWGGCLSALRWHTDPSQRELIEVRCDQAQKPGD